MMHLRKVTALLALCALVGCSKGGDLSGPSSFEDTPSIIEAPQVEGPSTPLSTSSNAFDPFLRQRHFSVRLEGRVITARLSNPYDHPLSAGDMRQVWMSNFNRGSNPQGFIRPGPGDDIGPKVVHEKETVEWSQEMPYGACRIETEVYFGGEQRTTNGGPGGYNIGFGYIDIPGSDCKKPKDGPKCEERPTFDPEEEGTDTAVREVEFCTSCPEGTFENYQGACQPNLTCEDYEVPTVTVDFSVTEGPFGPSGVPVTGSTCTASHNLPLSVCGPTHTITPPLPHTVAPGTSQEFTFSYTGDYVPEGTQVACPVTVTAKDTVVARALTCEEQGNLPQGQLGGLSFSPFTPAKPAVPAVTQTFYWYDGENSGIQDDCLAEGGLFAPNTNIPGGDGQSDTNVCKTPVNHGSEWEYDHNDEADREFTQVVIVTPGVPAVPASGGNPISGSASVANAGVWKLVLKATTPGDFNKDTDEVTLACGQSATLNVSYPWVGHSSENWFLQLFLNGNLVQTGPITLNPTN